MALTQGQFKQLLAALPGMIGAGKPTRTWEQHQQWALEGMKDWNLAEKALAERYSLQTLISTGSTREKSKATAEAIQGKSTATHRLRDTDDMSEGEMDRTSPGSPLRR